MRFLLAAAMTAIALAAAHAGPAQPRVAIRSVGVLPRQDATSIVIETTGDTPLRIVPQNDRVDIDLPRAEWRAEPPVIDRRAGLVESFRRVPASQGVHLVFMTRTGYGMQDGGPVATAANGNRIYTIVLGIPSTAPLVTVTGDAPVVIQGSGYVPLVANPKPQPLPAIQPAVECTPRLLQQGSIDGKPVLGFGNCPAGSAQ